MFFNLVRKNNKRNRKENGLFFASLIVAIAAFYIILSLEKQDVILFLQKMESDALEHLFALIPVLYGISLFILFFLVYFAGKYQLDRRSHEFGMYLMMGMRRSKLFLMLLAEEVFSSLISLAVGIPAAILLSEIVSLVMARIVGIGIIGHRFTFSASAVFWTVVGYFVIRLAALAVLSGSFAKKEIGQLLSESQEKKQKVTNPFFTAASLLFGIVLLGAAYGLAITGIAWKSVLHMGIVVIVGISATFLLFHGIGLLFGTRLNKRKNKKGLGIFTFRQLQETVFIRSNSLAVTSLLVLMALCCFGFGVSGGFTSGGDGQHVLDYTFEGEEKQIKEVLENPEIAKYMDQIFEVQTVSLSNMEGEPRFFAASMLDAVKAQNEQKERDVLVSELDQDTLYLISLSGYNRILAAAGKEILHLEKDQAAFYSDPDFSNIEKTEVVNRALQDHPYVEIDAKKFRLVENFCQDNIVTDRFINISCGLIVPDEVFLQAADGSYSSYWNAVLKKDIVDKEGLMQVITQVNDLLSKTPLRYESYLQNIGRQLFYKVAASYTMIYLAAIFLIIANTVMGVQFLMQQQKTKKRYQTLINLGCHYKDLCHSAGTQIIWYFGLPVSVAAVGSLFGVRSLFSGVLTAGMQDNITVLLFAAIPMIVLLCVVEFIYIGVVIRLSSQRILEMMDMKREDS